MRKVKGTKSDVEFQRRMKVLDGAYFGLKLQPVNVKLC